MIQSYLTNLTSTYSTNWHIVNIQRTHSISIQYIAQTIDL